MAALLPSRRRKLIYRELNSRAVADPGLFLEACKATNVVGLRYNYLGRYPITLDPNGKSITETTLSKGAYQSAVFETFAKLVDITGLRFVNVGANIGTSCLNAHSVGFRDFVALEPVKSNFDFLKSNVTQEDSKISLHHLAAGNEAGKATINLHPSSGGRHSLVKKFGPKTEEIEIVRLDDFVSREPSVLWIDTEGFEYKVLLGSEAFVRSSVKALCLEVTPKLLGDDFPKLIDFLRTHFKIFYNVAGEKIDADRLEVSLAGEQRDLIAIA